MPKKRPIPFVVKFIYGLFGILGVLSNVIVIFNLEKKASLNFLFSQLAGPILLEFFRLSFLPVIVIISALYHVGIKPRTLMEYRGILILFLVVSLTSSLPFLLPLVILTNRPLSKEPVYFREGENYRRTAIEVPEFEAQRVDSEQLRSLIAERARRIAREVFLRYGEIIEYRDTDGKISPYMPQKEDYEFRRSMIKSEIARATGFMLAPWLISLHIASILCVIIAWNTFEDNPSSLVS